MIRLHQNHNKKAQSTIEWTMVVVILAAALLCMQHYIKRAAEGRLREAADTIGDQYDAHHVDSNIVTTQFGSTRITSVMERTDDPEAEDEKIDGLKTTIRTTNEITRKTGYEELEEFPAGLFD